MHHILFPLILLLSFSCSSPQRKVANYPESELKSLTAEELFLQGKVNYGKRKLHPFDENHFGQELDLSDRRPVVSLDKTVYGLKYAKAGHSVYGNFYHEHKFWVVRVPQDGVDRVFMHIAYFAPVVMKKYFGGHTYLRFEFKKDRPIEIVAAMPTDADLETQVSQVSELPENPLIHNAGLTAEAQWIKADKKKKYDFLRGKNSAFTQITRFISIQHRLWAFIQNGDPLRQIEFKIENPNAVFKEGLLTSERDALNVRYDTLGQNCTTTAFDILQRGSGIEDKRFLPLIKYLQKSIPALVVPKTQIYGGQPSVATIDDPSLRSEWKAIYERDYIKNQGKICGPDISPARCQNSKNAIEAIQSWEK
jgi:hypothetical protein